MDEDDDCVALVPYDKISGMQKWCQDNCKLGNCPEQASYRHSHQLNFAFSLLQSAFFATNFSLKKRDPNLELF